jgi:hypothetical protein
MTVTAEDLELREASVALVESAEGGSPVAPDGTVTMRVIRPGVGRGRGKHLYEAKMLEANAGKFTGWKMYVNHLSPEAKRAMGGLPRDVRDLGGRILESWWDPTVPEVPGRFKAGAVMAKAKPTPFIRELIDNDPEIVEASISATATGVKPGQADGQRVWVVEGIEDRGSVDWVTEAGAGGRVVSLMEAAMDADADGTLALLASMTDDEFRGLLRERPDLVEALRENPNPDSKPAVEEAEDMPNITPEMLTEALADEDTRDALLEALDLDSYVAGLVHSVVTNNLPRLVEAAVEAERDVIRATARADADRRVQIEQFRATAHGLIESTRLPDPLKDRLRDEFNVVEGEPTSALDVIDKLDGDGKVEKPASAVLRESVEARIAQEGELVASLRPTRVRGQGPSAGSIQEGDPQPGEARKQGEITSGLLQEAGFGEVDPWAVDSPKALQG